MYHWYVIVGMVLESFFVFLLSFSFLSEHIGFCVVLVFQAIEFIIFIDVQTVTTSAHGRP